MAREIFEVTKDRFHLQDPCCYILQGTLAERGKNACLPGRVRGKSGDQEA